MTPAGKKWLLRLIKFGVCAGALWYLSGMVTLHDYVHMADSPDKKYRLVEETDETVRIRDVDTGEERVVPRSSFMASDQSGQSPNHIDRGLISIVRRVDWSWARWAMLAFVPSVFICAWRLRLLLATHQIPLTFRDAFLLTLAGNFFNFAMPGMTGGDLYKAYHIAKRTHKRTEGVTIVFLDRVIGLISFLLLATGTIAVLTVMDKPMIGEYGRWVGYFLLAFIVGAGLYFSRRFRRWIRYEALLERLPFADKLRRVDETALSFRWHPRLMVAALLVTLVNHFLIVTSIYCLAHGFGIHPRGDQTEGDLYLASLLATSVGFLFAAIPISIQGFGLFEAVFFRVLVQGGWCTASQMLAVTLGSRLVQIVWSLPGVAVPWMGFARPRGPTATEENTPAE